VLKIFFFVSVQLCLIHTTAVVAQNQPLVTVDTIYANTQPAAGYKSFLSSLERTLSNGDTVGRKYKMRLNNIGFFVSTTGVIDSAWTIFRERPIHLEIIKFLKGTQWKPAEHGQPVVSHQEILDHEIYLTKGTLKRHRHWRSLPERILSPWSN
jgi:hypothetical protein